jgi:ATP-dependent helicase HrpA
MRRQLDEMLGQDFLRSTTLEWLEQFPRYLQGILQRISKLGQSRDRDVSATSIISRYWSMYRSVIDKEGGSSPSEQVIEFRWMIEELRVSLFAQQLGTKLPISEKRLQKAWDKVV